MPINVKGVLLPTAQIYISDKEGNRVQVRALLDQGSQASFITAGVAQILKITYRSVHITLKGIGSTTSAVICSVAAISIHSLQDEAFTLNCDVLIMPKLTGLLPVVEVSNELTADYAHLPLADPLFYKPAKIDALLGSDVYNTLIREGLYRIRGTGFIAQQTTLGWVLSGPVNVEQLRRAETPNDNSAISMLCAAEEDLRNSLQRLWQLEELLEHKTYLKPDEEKCESYFKDTFARNEEGRYVVRLPFRERPSDTEQETRLIALRSLTALRKRLSRDQQLNNEYNKFMSVYQQLGHLERVSEEKKHRPAWYLPHHAVIQEKPRRKIRVVFDASRQMSNRMSLNQFLLPGPPLQNDLTLVITNWRRHRYVYSCDIIKMFRQIVMYEEDRDFQRILWAPYEAGEPTEYRLTTVTYGTACAPYLALRTLRQLITDEGDQFPLGSQCLGNQSFVDDIFGGAEHLKEGIEERDELIALLKRAGFKLDKWSANHPTLLPSSQEEGHQINDSVYINLQDVVKTLGLQWNPRSDSFGFTRELSTENARTYSKRSVLSCISKLFDPLGWISPVSVDGKIFLHDLWLAKLNWDDELVDEHRSSWFKYQNSLIDLNAIKIDRWLTMRTSSRVELHGFSDASTRAYAATVYVRITSEEKTVHVNLLAAKTKVSPVKTVSIPNLELCGATLLVRLIKHVQKLDFLKSVPVIAWSDSQVVLAWIKQHPSRWKQFVANRVSTIQTELPNARWQYVPTKSNPADLATRGMSPKELSESSLWWHGPCWLSQSSDQWPRQEKITNLHEEHAQVHLVNRTSLNIGNDKDTFINRFSNLNRAVRVVAWCLRYVTNYRRRKRGEQVEGSFITVSELSKARIALIKLTQRIEFSNDIVAVRNNQQLPRNSPLKRLNPYLDDEGVLRVMGRLRHSSVLYDAKYPPILPKNSHLARLYVRHAHQDCWHGGTAVTLSTLRTQVWVVGGPKLVKYTVRNCVRCARYRSQPVTQRMGDLPSSRVNLERPFSETGVDYAGPILVRRNTGRDQASCKGYIALFVCMATKAVHLEAVGDLTTETFLNAYRRFASRHGVCRKLYSDNGTNFRGADTELRNLFQ